MGNEGSKLALRLPSKKFEGGHASSKKAAKIGILAFEVASVMSKATQLWDSLGEREIRRLQTEVIHAEGVRILVSDNEALLLGLACLEKLQDLNNIAISVARMSRKSSDPSLKPFERISDEILKGEIDAIEAGFTLREFPPKLKKMKKYINSTSRLYQEMSSLVELEQAFRRCQRGGSVNNNNPNLREGIERKILWQKHEIKYLKKASLWNRCYSEIVPLLARTIYTTYLKVLSVFAYSESLLPNLEMIPSSVSSPTGKSHSQISHISMMQEISYQPNLSALCFSPRRQSSNSIPNLSKASRIATTAALIDSLPVSKAGIFLLPVKEYHSVSAEKRLRFLFDPKRRVQSPPSSTLGGAALSLHYANIIIIVEKMASYPHLISTDAREDLYHMLPNSLRMALRRRLSGLSFFDDFSISNPQQELLNLLGWLAPLAHNMIRWQSQHNIEQHSVIIPRNSANSNILLLQTLYFADLQKTEIAITESLVGLNSLIRYERSIQANAWMMKCLNKQEEEMEIESKLDDSNNSK